MPEEKPLNDNLVLVLAKPGPWRDQLQKAMREERLEASFVSDTKAVTELLTAARPGTFVQDWATLEPTQAAQLQQRLGKSGEIDRVCRIIYVETVTPELTALAVDCGVRRVVTYAASLRALVMEVKMAQAAMRNLPEIQQLIAKTKAGGRYDQAEVDRSIELAYLQYPHDPSVSLEYGNLSLRRNELTKAKDIANNLVRTQPQNVRAMNLLSRALMKEGKNEEAAAVLERANNLSPFNTDRLVMLGDVFFKTGDKVKAGTYYIQAMALEPQNLEAQKGQGQVKLSQGDVNAALELLRNSASEEESVGFFNNAAVHAAKIGDYNKAHGLYLAAVQALRSDKYKPILYFNMAMNLERMGELVEAQKTLKRSLKFDPNFAKSIRLLKRIERILAARTV